MLDYKDNDSTFRCNPNIRINYSNKQSEIDSNITPDIEDYIETQYSIVTDSPNESKTIEKPTKDPVIYDVNPEKYGEIEQEPISKPKPQVKSESKQKIKSQSNSYLKSQLNSNLNINKPKYSTRIKTAQISGTVLDAKTCLPIGCAKVSLYRKYIDCPDKLVTSTTTNKNGEYVFTDITAGLYVVQITASCYKTKCFCTAMVTDLTPVKVTTTLTSDGTTQDSNCCVFGIINNSQNKPISNANVVLYEIDSSNTPTQVATTTTDSCGKYQFKNVPRGNYKVTANGIDISTLSIDGTCKKVQIYNN